MAIYSYIGLAKNYYFSPFNVVFNDATFQDGFPSPAISNKASTSKASVFTFSCDNQYGYFSPYNIIFSDSIFKDNTAGITLSTNISKSTPHKKPSAAFVSLSGRSIFSWKTASPSYGYSAKNIVFDELVLQFEITSYKTITNTIYNVSSYTASSIVFDDLILKEFVSTTIQTPPALITSSQLVQPLQPADYTPPSIQLAKVSGSSDNIFAKAYTASNLSAPAYFTPSEVVIGDSVVYNSPKPNTIISSSAFVPSTYQVTGALLTTYQYPSNIIFGAEENIRQNTSNTARYKFIPSGFVAPNDGTGKISISYLPNNYPSGASVQFAQALGGFVFSTATALANIMKTYGGKSPSTPFGASDIIFEQIEANAPPTSFNQSSARGIGNISPAYPASGLINTSDNKPYFNASEIIIGDLVSYNSRKFPQASYTSTIKETGSGPFNSISLSSAVVEARLITPTATTPSIQLFKLDSSATYSSTEAYISTTGPYFNASEVVIGDLTKFNTSQFGSSVPVSASVVKSFGNYTGLSPYTYITPQNVVFGDGELYNTTQLQTIGITSSYKFVVGSLGYFGDGKITLSSPDVSANIRTISTDASIQLFKFDSFATYSITEAYVGSGLSVPAYFNPSEIVTGDLIVYNNAKPNTTVSGSAVVPSTYSYTGILAKTYITPPNIVFGDGELYNATQLKADTQARYSFVPLGFTSADGKITLSSPDVSTNIKTISTDASIQLFKFDTTGASYVSVEAYVSTKGPYFDASEIVLGDLIKSNTSQFGTGAATFAVVSKQFGNYSGTSPYTYITPQNVVFGEENLYNYSQVKVSSVSAASYRFASAANYYTGSGTITLSSAAGTPLTPSVPGIGLFSVSGTCVVRLRDWEYISPTSFFNPYDIVFSDVLSAPTLLFSYKKWDPTLKQYVTSANTITDNYSQTTGLFAISGGFSDIMLTDAYVATTPIQITVGSSADVPSTIAIYGTGFLFTAKGSTDSETSIPPTDTQLFQISGAYSNFKATSAEVATGTATISGGFSDIMLTDAWLASGTINVSSSAYVPSIISIRGTGSLFATSGSANSQTNIGVIDAAQFELFQLSGSYSNFASTYSETASGSISISGAYSNLKITDAYAASGTINLSGNAVIPVDARISGSGTLFTASGSSDRETSVPSTATQLFQVSGAYSNLQATSIYIGSGSITIDTGSSDRETSVPPTSTQLFQTSGSGVYTSTEAYATTGSVTISGAYSNLKATSIYIGTGSLSAASGSADRETSVPPTATQLFQTSGSGVYTSTEAYATTGSVTISGSGSQAQIKSYVGTGSLPAASGSSDRETSVPPTNTQLFQVSGAYSNLKATATVTVSGNVTLSGAVSQSQTEVYIGTGSLPAASGSSDRETSVPPTSTQLFQVSGAYSNLTTTSIIKPASGSSTISGSATYQTTNVTTQSGTATISGTSINVFGIGTYSGSGTLFFASGDAVVQVSVPPTSTQLFQVSGAYSNLKATKAEVFAGSLFTAFGSADAETYVPQTTTQLFSISGAAALSTFLVSPTSGTITISGTTSAIVSSVPATNIQLFQVSGSYSSVKSTSAYIGSGSIPTASGSVDSETYAYESNINAFTFGGEAVDKFVSDSWYGTGTIHVSDSAHYQTTHITEQSGTTTISGSGTVRGTIIPAETFGYLFTSGGSAQVEAFVPPVGSVNIYDGIGNLVVISGTANISVPFKPYEGRGNINTSGNASVRTKLPERIFATII